MRAGVRRLRSAAAVGVLAATLVMATNAGALTGTYTNPVGRPASSFPEGAADPFVVRVGATYHLFATNVTGKNVPHWSSTNLTQWTAANDALPTLPSWATGGYTWAPSILERWFGAPYYVLYYTARSDAAHGSRQCIGAATSSSISGPFTDSSRDPLVCQLDHHGSIDASPFVFPGQTGVNPHAVLVWKSEDNLFVPARNTTLWNAVLAASGLSTTTAPIPMLTSSRSNWEHGMIEAPSMTYDSARRAYSVLYAGHFNFDEPAYGIGWATCSTAYGVFFNCTRPTPNQLLVSNAAMKAPGSAETFVDNLGFTWLVFHAYPSDQCTGTRCTGSRKVLVDKFCFGSGGRLRTNGPSSTPQTFTRNASCTVDIP